jgi:hypothetical protein
VHRVRQFAAHIAARVAPEETELAGRVLPPRAYELFKAMPRADRRHALDVVAHLRAAVGDDPELLAAALLHDAAKGHRMRLWHRVAGVLLEAFAPRALRRLAVDAPRSWRYPFHLYLHHGALSAEAAVAAGCSPRVAGFIRGEPANEADAALLAALAAADEAS